MLPLSTFIFIFVWCCCTFTFTTLCASPLLPFVDTLSNASVGRGIKIQLVCTTPVTQKLRVNLSARHFLAPAAAVLLVPLWLSSALCRKERK